MKTKTRMLSVGMAALVASFGLTDVFAQGGSSASIGGSGAETLKSNPATFENTVAAAASKIYPSSSMPLGYSLHDMAEISGYFNTCVVFGSGLTPPISPETCLLSYYPDTPIQVLGGQSTYNVERGTIFYLPVYIMEPTPWMPPGYPLWNSNKCDQNLPECYKGRIGPVGKVRSYFFDPSGYGFYDIAVYVDGIAYPLQKGHVVGLSTPLVTGTQAYIASAAFVKPLPKGQHTLGFKGYVDGAAGKWNFDVPVVFTVNVN